MTTDITNCHLGAIILTDKLPTTDWIVATLFAVYCLKADWMYCVKGEGNAFNDGRSRGF